MFTTKRIVKTNLGVLTLNDLINRLEQENFFKNASFYLIEKINDNYLLFEVYANKITPKQIHEIEYRKDEKNIEIRSKYGSKFIPAYLFYLMPISLMIMGGKELIQEEWKILLTLILVITFFIIIFLFGTLREDSKKIERELSIRLNYLLREGVSRKH